MARHQSGYIYRKNGYWWLRYRDWVVQEGGLDWKQVARRLAKVSDQYRSKRSVRDLADELLAKVNSGVRAPEGAMKLAGFVDERYLPWVKEQKRQSTYKGYADMWRVHLKPRCSKFSIRDFRPCDGEMLMADVARANDLTRTTLRHIKNLMSGVFTYARRQGVLNGANPMQGVSIPKGRKSMKTYACSHEEILKMTMMLPLQAAAVVAAAGFGGFSRSELRGLRWENWRGNSLNVTQAVWNGVVTETKNEHREAAVRVIPHLATVLEKLRLASGTPDHGYIFAGRKGQPLNLDNLASRIIKPRLRSAGLEWHGWHAFRRGLATNLHRLGIKDEEIQAVLRHGDATTTRRFYIKSTSETVAAAMKAMEEQLCTTVHQLEGGTQASGVIN
jgi:integrase